MEGKLNGKSVLDENGTGEKVDDYLSDAFPAGLRILTVDDDKESLTLLENMLKRCQYEVTKCERAMEALYLLREDRNRFDIVICDLHMPEIDGFKLLEIASLEMDLPVIIMSGDDEKEVILKGIIHGACDYWVKPVHLETIRLIWQHVVRKRRKSCLKEIQQPVGCTVDAVVRSKNADQGEPMSLRNKGDIKLYKKRKDDQEDDGEPSNVVTYAKKQRMVWTRELHQKFVAAVDQLGHDRAVPKKILECMQSMGITDVTRENIASHLQKYRLYIQKMKPGAVDENARDSKAIQSRKSMFGRTYSSNLWNIQSYRFSHQFLQSNGWRLLPTDERINRHQLIERSLNQPQAIESQIAYATSNFGLSLDDDQGSILQPRTAEPSGNPITELHNHDFDVKNHVYEVNAAVEISSLGDGSSHKNTTPYFVANELDMQDPSVLAKQFDQADFFRGPFA
ncbi:hypothetical protein SLA2020_171370 [Shorea laevis]